MTIQRQYRYKDPAEVYEIEERKTCKGCRFRTIAWSVEACEHPKRAGKAVRRCKYYVTKEGD